MTEMQEAAEEMAAEETVVEEIEIDEDAIVGYIYDENDNEIGLVVVDENGEETELYYADDEDAEGAADEELIELEVDEDAIVGYIYDEDDNEIGIVVADEDGREQEYYYADDDEPAQPDTSVSQKVTDTINDEFDLGITREGVSEATSNLNDIYKDGAAIASEFKEVFSDINDGLGFLTKKKR